MRIIISKLALALKCLYAPIYSLFWATVLSFLFGLAYSMVREFFSDFFYRWPKLFKVLFWQRFYPEAFYYNLYNDKGGCGPATWHYKKPSNNQWKPAHDWWVLRGY